MTNNVIIIYLPFLKVYFQLQIPCPEQFNYDGFEYTHHAREDTDGDRYPDFVKHDACHRYVFVVKVQVSDI